MSCKSCNQSIVIPSFKQAMNGVIPATKAMLNVDNATGDVIKARLEICRHCDKSTKNEKYKNVSNGLTNLSQCTECACVILLKTKGKDSKCPLNKW